MILHVLIVDDEEDVLESPVPGFLRDLSEGLAKSRDFQSANLKAGSPFPADRPLNVKVSAIGYESSRLAKYKYHSPAHIHVHLCCEKGGSFRHALRLLREQFFAVVVSDMRFSEDSIGSRAGRFFVDDVIRRHPETTGVLYSAYHRPDDFPPERFVRKGSPTNLGGEELLAKIIAGIARYLNSPDISQLARELSRRGLVYQSDEFGSMLRRAYDLTQLYLGLDEPSPDGRRRPRPMLLIDGETGTGKTELAGLIHAMSNRRQQPFVSATCNQLTDEQFLRSVLFGHVRGSFSGATADRAGLVETAGRGILLLDDLHKLTDGGSVILHSFLDDGEYSHLGQDETRRSAACAIVATVETPRWEEIKTKQKLSESFINRAEQLVIRIPPLAARPDDIELQARTYSQYFAKAVGQEMDLSEEAIAWLVDRGFPGGNSRKLRDFVKGLVGHFARVTDFIDLPEMEEYAQEIRLSMPPPTGGSSRSGPVSPPQDAPVASADSWKSLDDDSGWKGRIARLAAAALVDEIGLPAEEAWRKAEGLFQKELPRVWKEVILVLDQSATGQGGDIKLFDELLRYFVVFETGNPAKAAKLLGMKDNALREFIYSREQKRGTAGDQA
ncbi:sigma 54-interacting transcriptional regulator [bacterium]|nr:sigma 54-interacting transcriptional regulator [bacterium]